MTENSENKKLALSMLDHVRAVVLVLQSEIEAGFPVSDATLGDVAKLSVASRRLVQNENLKNLFK